MKIYHITTNKAVSKHDTILAFVIIATTPNQALLLAKKECWTEGPDAWEIENTIEVGEYTGSEKIPFILCTDSLQG